MVTPKRLDQSLGRQLGVQKRWVTDSATAETFPDCRAHSYSSLTNFRNRILAD